jgi:integrase
MITDPEEASPATRRAAWVDRIRPASSRRELPDRGNGRITGLYLVVQPSGAKSWAVRYRHNGKPRKMTIGTCAAFNLAEAREAAHKALNAVAKGVDPAQQQQTQAQTPFEAAVREHIARHAIGPKGPAQPKNRSWREAARLLGLRTSKKGDDLAVLKGGLVNRWGKRPVGDIRRDEIIAVLDDIADRAPYTANRTLAYLRKFYNWALPRYRLAESPCRGVQPPGEETSRDRVLSDDELRRVWHAAGELNWPFSDIVRLLALTGQRLNEVARMEWSEVDLEAKLWTLPHGRVKNAKGHTVPLSSTAIAIVEPLSRKERKSKFLFSVHGEPVCGFARPKSRLDELSGVTGWRLHDLRRTCASGLAALKTPVVVVEKILNHSSGSLRGVTGVYNRFDYAEEKAQALEAWGRRVVEEIAERRPANVTRLADVREAV